MFCLTFTKTLQIYSLFNSNNLKSECHNLVWLYITNSELGNNSFDIPELHFLHPVTYICQAYHTLLF